MIVMGYATWSCEKKVDLESAQTLVNNYSYQNAEPRKLEASLIKSLIVFFLTKRDSLSGDQLFRMLRKYDHSLVLGIIEQSVLELLVDDVIVERNADVFQLNMD